ncbi:MAG: VWA domain-containing protein [Planctomycetota bacterium]|nr:MAG: VWA domain-containing protein [Planctomycetota bacterium]
MSWIPTLGWAGWLAIALVPPLIIMLYFLKLRRQPVEVPSTYLWRRTIEDLHVNSIWQRLRKNLLLLLQLVAVAAMILALLRPGIRGSESLGDRRILLIDNSCSMQATDVESSRLARAKKEALELIDGMETNDAVMVIAFSDRADIRQGFTSDKRRLRAAIQGIEPTFRTTDLNEALRAASGLANPGRTSQMEDLNDIQVAEALPATLYIFSDGGFPPPQIDLGNLTATYVPIGSPDAHNVGIVAFTVERNAENETQVAAFAQVQNFGTEAADAGLSLYLDDELIDARQVQIDAESASGVEFEIQNLETGRLRLELEYDDALAADNIAYAGLDPPKQLEVVLVTEGNAALEAALSTSRVTELAAVRVARPSELETPEFGQLLRSGTVDLFIFDGCAPAVAPEANTLYIDALPPGDQWGAGEPSGPLFIIDVNRSHPLMQYVDLGTVRIVEGRALQMPGGGTELARTDAGILMAVAPRDAYLDAVIAMPLIRRTEEGAVPNTDWPIKRGFPVFFFNALQVLGGATATAASKSVQPGNPVPLAVTTRYESVEVLRPDGGAERLERGNSPQFIYSQTDLPGFYQVTGGEGRLLQLFAVNLFSDRESNIRPAPELQIGAETVEGKVNQKELVRVEYWRWLLIVALIVLGIEWYAYNRRIAL